MRGSVIGLFSAAQHHDLALVFQVHDIFHPFIQTSDDEITFITVNESKTGFCHLYKITSVLQRGSYNWAKGYTPSKGTVIHKHTLYCSGRSNIYFRRRYH